MSREDSRIDLAEAEAKIARVEALLADWEERGIYGAADRLRAALEGEGGP